MSKEIKEHNPNEQLVNFNESYFEHFRSFYYLIKGKRDTDIKLFDDSKQFSYSDLLELNDKIYKKLELHEVITDIVSVTVGLDNKEIKDFGNWIEFTKTDWNISAKTKYISMEWDFNLKLPNQSYEIPQTHTLRVRIGNNLKPSEMIQVVFQGEDDAIFEEAKSQMVCKIDFVNSQICNELKAIVCAWYDALPNTDNNNKFIELIIKNITFIDHLIVLSFLTSSIILCNYFYSFVINYKFTFIPTDTIQRLFFFLTSSIPIIYFFYRFGVLFSRKMVEKIISNFSRNPMFYFTKGDKNRLKEIELSNKKLLKQLVLNIFYGLSTNFIAYLIGLILIYLTIKK